jgi:hypothetical protein
MIVGSMTVDELLTIIVVIIPFVCCSYSHLILTDIPIGEPYWVFSNWGLLMVEVQVIARAGV